jgi:hypothetical protein
MAAYADLEVFRAVKVNYDRGDEMFVVLEEKWRRPTLSFLASIATMSLNLPRQTSISWTFAAASGVRVKLSTTIAGSFDASHGDTTLWCSCRMDRCGKNASLARFGASTSPTGSRQLELFVNSRGTQDLVSLVSRHGATSATR